MSDLTDLIARLRAGTGGGKHWMDLHTEAADMIERLAGKAEPVAWGFPNTRPTERVSLLMVRLEHPGGEYPERWIPLYAHPAAPAPDPTATECPRCKNDIRRCDCNMGAPAPAPTIIVTGPVGCGKSAVMEIIYKALRDAGLHPYSDDLAHERRMVDKQPEPAKVWNLTEKVAPAAPAPDDARDAARYRYLRKGFWNLTTLQAANGLGLDLREVYVDSPEKLDYVIDAAMKEKP